MQFSRSKTSFNIFEKKKIKLLALCFAFRKIVNVS